MKEDYKTTGGIFYANLRDVTETVKFGMKTLAYHEGIPGHHFQIAIQGELKMFRSLEDSRFLPHILKVGHYMLNNLRGS